MVTDFMLQQFLAPVQFAILQAHFDAVRMVGELVRISLTIPLVSLPWLDLS